MLGLIVTVAEQGSGLAPHALLDELLGAPMLTRAIAGALPVSEPVTGIVVVPDDLIERVKHEVIERFGIDEIDNVIGGASDFSSALRAALKDLPEDIERVIIQRGECALVPNGLVDTVAKAQQVNAAAAPAIALNRTLVADIDGKLMEATDTEHLRELQFPIVVEVSALKKVLNDDSNDDSPALWFSKNGDDVALVEGDADNNPLKSAADVSRAVEVFSRRAVDYPFVFPRDLLPNDPLAKALAPGTSPAPVIDDEKTSEQEAVEG